MRLRIRPWELKDAAQLVYIRNHPDLMKWFRQDRDLTLSEQIEFMQWDMNYHGYVLEYGKKLIGFVAYVTKHKNQDDVEFSIGVLPEYQGKGFARTAMRFIEDRVKGAGFRVIYSWVFLKNPALSFYTWKCGFEITGVSPSYTTKGDKTVAAVYIQKEL